MVLKVNGNVIDTFDRAHSSAIQVLAPIHAAQTPDYFNEIVGSSIHGHIVRAFDAYSHVVFHPSTWIPAVHDYSAHMIEIVSHLLS